jgi:6-phosphogluconolactonase
VTQTRTIRIDSTEALVAHLIGHLCFAVEAAVALRGCCTLAIPGGSVAAAVLPAFSQRQLPWHAVDVFWCDERAVPLAHQDSNAGAALRLVADSPLAQRARLHVMRGDASDLWRAADDYAAELAIVAGSPPVCDVVLLGMGEDGHVASLFPGHIAEVGPWTPIQTSVLVTTRAPKAPPTRLSLSLSVLTAARETIVMAFGSAKAPAVHDALEGNRLDTPCARVVRESRRVLLLLDPHAASQLEHPPTQNFP